MNINNFIETQYRELLESGLNSEFIHLYASVGNQQLREIFSTLHYDLNSSFRTMNSRLPTGPHGAHFWAANSRDLIRTIEITLSLYNGLKGSSFAFEIEQYYKDLLFKCRDFLSPSCGSEIPPNMPKIELIYVIPIFTPISSVSTPNLSSSIPYELKLIGSGSYANVYKYKDTFYNRPYALKRAKKDLNAKELERFKREFDVMNELNSPYILEVYCYDPKQNHYIMEYMDNTLDKFITTHNGSLSFSQRKGLAFQILRAFDYLHSKKRLHRDISPKNILIKEYDDVPVIKISDFGLVKIPDSELTAFNTEFKGYFNDPALATEGFYTYNIFHEVYALTRIIYFVLTGKTNTDRIKDPALRDFVEKGLNPDKTKRFKNVREMMDMLRELNPK